jgi:hypothetical protein
MNGSGRGRLRAATEDAGSPPSAIVVRTAPRYVQVRS